MTGSSAKRSLFFAICIISCLSFQVFGQCGTYFKTGYRAVNKITSTAQNGVFLLADWNGDGKDDFWGFRPNSNSSAVDVVIYLAQPTGYWNWDSPVVLTTDLPITTSTVGQLRFVKDFNSDGLTDLFMFDNAGNGRIYKNSGNGSLVPLAINNSFEPFVSFADINGDGLLDYVDSYALADNFQGSIGYRPLTADGTFGPRIDILTSSEILGSTVKVGDFTGDGKPDIAYSKIGLYHVFYNDGGGRFSSHSAITGRPWTFDASFVPMDLNNDGRIDLLASVNGSPTRLFYLLGQGDGTFTETEIPNINNFDSYFKVVELNGDTKFDIIQYGSTRYSTYINNGDGSFTRTDYPTSLGSDQNNYFFEDFSGDHKADFYDLSHELINVFGEEVVVIKENVCQRFGETKRINFDGNYYSDYVLWNGSTGQWSSRNAQWGVGFTPTTYTNWGSAALGDIPTPGDYDGDGKTDYAVYRNSEGNWYILLSSTSSWLVTHFGLPNDIPVPNDYDGGGKTDIAVFRPSDGNWYVWYTETQSFAAVHFGSNGDKPVPSDFDGDGKTDVAVFRPTEGNWYWLRSSDGGWSVVHWGISSDVPVPGDFDGDGKADPAIFRNGQWWVLRSSNPSYGLFNLGTTGDIPFAFNREGDLSEIVAYRPSVARWNNLRYRSGGVVPLVYVLEFGQPGDSPVNFGLPQN